MNEPIFTHDWTSNNFNVWNEVLREMKGKPDLRALEIGCYEGRATRWFLENVLTDESSTISVIDTFEGSQEHAQHGIDFSDTVNRFHYNTAPWERRVNLYIGTSREWLGGWNIRRYDLIYVDGSHRAADVLADGVLSWQLLKQGGILIFDDYAWDAYPEPELNPRLAIDAFLKVYASQIKILHKSYQVIIQRL